MNTARRDILTNAPGRWLATAFLIVSGHAPAKASCAMEIDSLFTAKAYSAVVDCAADTGQRLSASRHYRVVLSHLYQNRLGKARAYGDSILALVPSDDPWRDSIAATSRYLAELLEHRITPPARPARWKWTSHVGLSHGIGSFAWKPGTAEWGQTLATQYQRSAGLLREPSVDALQASETRHTNFDASGSGSYAGALLRHRLSVSGRLGLVHDSDGVGPGMSHTQLQYSIQRASWEASTNSVVQWDGSELFSRSLGGQVGWTRGKDGRSFAWTLHGGVSDHPTLGLAFKQADFETSYIGIRANWTTRSTASLGILSREGAAVRRTPVRIASCRDIQDGRAASEQTIVCYTDPSSEDIAALHPFKGISGYPFRPSDPLVNRSWSSLMRAGATQLVHREGSRGRWNTTISVEYGFEHSLDPVEWNNGFLGNTVGDSLLAFHDRTTGRDLLWERDIRGRFLELARRERYFQLHTGTIQTRLGWRPFAKGEIFVAGSASRSWTDLPSESGESGYVRWLCELGWSWNL